MSDSKTLPPKPSRRGYILLITAVVVVVAGWSAAWFYGRSVLAGQLDLQMQRMAQQGVDLSCADLAIAGFPFRYEVSCRDMRSADRRGATGSLAGLNAVALVYNPWHVIFEARSPAQMSVPLNGLAGGLDWTTARASLKFSDNALGAFDAVIDEPEVSVTTPVSAGEVSADKAELHLREAPDVDGMLEGFVTVDNLTLASLPDLREAVGLRSHVRVGGGMALLAGADLVSLVRARGELPVRLMLAEATLGNSRAVASGDLVVAGDGTLTGTLEVALGNADVLLRTLKPLFPPQDSTFALIENMVRGLDPAATEIDGMRTITIPVTFNRGLVQIGLLPVGRIPPLFSTGS